VLTVTVVSNMNKLILVILLLLIFSSTQRLYKDIDFGRFKITVPASWHKIDLQGMDSYVGGIVTEYGDTLKFDLGRYSGDLINQDYPMVYDSIDLLELSDKELMLLPETKHLIVEKKTGKINYIEYLKYKFEYDTIDGLKAKIITPRNNGYGGSGIYIDSLPGGRKGNKIKFSFYGWYLNEKVNDDFHQALKTLKFKKLER